MLTVNYKLMLQPPGRQHVPQCVNPKHTLNVSVWPVSQVDAFSCSAFLFASQDLSNAPDATHAERT